MRASAKEKRLIRINPDLVKLITGISSDRTTPRALKELEVDREQGQFDEGKNLETE